MSKSHFRVGIMDSGLALNLTRYLEKEEDYVPWETAILHFEALDVLMQESPALSLFHVRFFFFSCASIYNFHRLNK